MAGASQALDRLTIANARFEIENEATGRSVTYQDFNLVFDRSGDEARARISASDPLDDGPSRRAPVGDEPSLALEARRRASPTSKPSTSSRRRSSSRGRSPSSSTSRLAPGRRLQSLTGRFAVGAGTVSSTTPTPFRF